MNKKGFSLIEILIAMMILGSVVTVATPALLQINKLRIANIREYEINRAAQSYMEEMKSLNLIINNTSYSLIDLLDKETDFSTDEYKLKMKVHSIANATSLYRVELELQNKNKGICILSNYINGMKDFTLKYYDEFPIQPENLIN